MSTLRALRTSLDEGAHVVSSRNGTPLVVFKDDDGHGNTVYSCHLAGWGVLCWGPFDALCADLDDDAWRVMSKDAFATWIKEYWATRKAFNALLGDIEIGLEDKE